MIAAACSDDAGDESTNATSTGGPADESPTGVAAVCPDPLVIQTDWFPEAEYGATYQLIGPDPEIDTAAKVVRGPLVTADGTETGIDVEVRTGGPAIAGGSVIETMQTDRDVLLGYLNTDDQVRNYSQIATTAVVAPLEINPQVVMWDPASHPGVSAIADLQDDDVTIRYSANESYMDFLVNSGQVRADQLDPSYDGSPAVFVAEGGAVAQQGFATSEPFTYEFLIPEWGSPVSFELIHDTGWETYSQSIGVLTERLDDARPCLKAFVPLMQETIVAYANDPDETNQLIVDVVAAFDDFWIYDLPLAEFSIEQQLQIGIVDNGPNDTIGDFDLDRVADFLPLAVDVLAATDPPDDLTPDDLVTNEFIDTSIGL